MDQLNMAINNMAQGIAIPSGGYELAATRLHVRVVYTCIAMLEYQYSSIPWIPVLEYVHVYTRVPV